MDRLATEVFETHDPPILVESLKTILKQLVHDKTITDENAQLLAKTYVDRRLWAANAIAPKCQQSKGIRLCLTWLLNEFLPACQEGNLGLSRLGLQSYRSNISTFLAGTTSAELELHADARQVECVARALYSFRKSAKTRNGGGVRRVTR